MLSMILNRIGISVLGIILGGGIADLMNELKEKSSSSNIMISCFFVCMELFALVLFIVK
jgi:hypothetical protein